MLTPEQIAALRDLAGQFADPINDYLISDIARRIAGAGQLTSSAAHQVWRAQQLGMSQREIKKRLKKLLKVSNRELRQLLTQSAEVGYRFDLERLPTSAAIPFDKNESLQQIVAAAVTLAQDDFTNLTQTLGMVDPYGNALPLQEAYRSCTDFAFQKVSSGAADYNTAIREATKNLADQGVRVIDYESGVHTSLEAAVRRNIMGGLGLMQEQIAQSNHDMLGCDGWEISAHAASAPDHEPIQGKQYGDAEYGYIGDAEDVAEGVDVTIEAMSTTTTTATVKKAMKGVSLTDEAILSGYGNPVGEANTQIAMSIAAKLDNDAMDELQKATLSYDGSAKQIGYAGIVDAIDLFEEEVNTEKVMYVHPKQVTTLRKDTDFLSADKYQGGVMVSGEIGMIANTRIVPSKKVPLDDTGVMYLCPIVKMEEDAETEDSVPALTIYLKRGTNVETERKPKNRTTEITADKFYTVVLSNEAKVVLAKFKK